MRNREDGRRYFHMVRHGSPDYFLTPSYPEWMIEEQRRQAAAYMRGQAIPTDPEIASAFRDCFDHNTRATEWAYGTVPSYIVGPQAYEWWCGFINETVDQDLLLDAGL